MTWDEIRTLEAIRDGKQLDERQRELAERMATPNTWEDGVGGEWSYLERVDDGYRLTWLGEHQIEKDDERARMDRADEEGEGEFL